MDFNAEYNSEVYEKVIRFCAYFSPFYLNNFAMLCRPDMIEIPKEKGFIIMPYYYCNMHKYNYGTVDVNGLN
jgi:hypothetical protein